MHVPCVQTSAEITAGALSGSDPVCEEAVDLFLSIVGAEAGAMALRCLAQGGVYIGGGITPRLLPRLRNCPSGGGALMDGFVCRNLRPRFREMLGSIPVYVITNDKVRCVATVFLGLAVGCIKGHLKFCAGCHSVGITAFMQCFVGCWAVSCSA